MQINLKKYFPTSRGQTDKNNKDSNGKREILAKNLFESGYKSFSPINPKERRDIQRRENAEQNLFTKKLQKEKKIPYAQNPQEAFHLKSQLELIAKTKDEIKIKKIIALIEEIQQNITKMNSAKQDYYILQISGLHIPQLNERTFFFNICYFARHIHFFRTMGPGRIKNTTSIKKIIYEINQYLYNLEIENMSDHDQQSIR
jgi:hypothetical protein